MRSARQDRLIVALDFTTLAPAVRMARQLRGWATTVKVGSALFTACGPLVVQRVRSLGFQVMLDLKFFDIPSTVELSCRAAVRQRVSILTVHAMGERAMLEAAVSGVRAEAAYLRTKRPQVFAVTVLTSMQGGSGDPARPDRVRERVLSLARTAHEAGCDGVVASAQEAAALRKAFGRRLRIICPGIRPEGASGSRPLTYAGARMPGLRKDDQRRICTPAQALRRGADLLVIGRPITAARSPREAVQRILEEMEGIHAC
jgi:orotidine-5'-phosphate decarboxylase